MGVNNLQEKKSVGTITFHAAHNYGSCLQAYALQNYVSQLGFDCEIINFRTERQKEQYRPLTKRKAIKYIVKNAYFLLNYKNRKRKYNTFEKFIDEQLVKSKTEYNSLDQLKASDLSYDCYIAGSDQIWNTVPNDADMAYFLPFVKNGKRISYAPSFGQIGKINQLEEITQYLNNFDSISVREENAVKLVNQLTGKTPPILVDPTLLITKNKWLELASERLFDGEYIFFYTLFAKKEYIDIAKKVSKKLNIPVVIASVSNQYEIFSGFVKKTWAGPKEFLSLVNNAKFICTTSFHCVVFSIIFNKPFFAINGMEDMRIKTLLSTTNLQNRSVSAANVDLKLNTMMDVDFSDANKSIKDQQEISKKFLINSISMEE